MIPLDYVRGQLLGWPHDSVIFVYRQRTWEAILACRCRLDEIGISYPCTGVQTVSGYLGELGIYDLLHDIPLAKSPLHEGKI